MQSHPGAYLLSALDFAVATYTMVMERVGVTGAADTLLTVLKGQQSCALTAWCATGSRPRSRRRSPPQALEMSFDCVALSAKTVDLGVPDQTVVAPSSGSCPVRTATDGIVAAATSCSTSTVPIDIDHLIAPQSPRAVEASWSPPHLRRRQLHRLGPGRPASSARSWARASTATWRRRRPRVGADRLVDVTGDGAEEASSR